VPAAAGTAERALPDRVEHHVIGLLVLGEVLRGAVNDPAGPQLAHQLQVRGIADRAHLHPAAGQQRTAADPMAPVAPLTSTRWPARMPAFRMFASA